MNEQKPPGAIEWTRVAGRRGYTWNPVQGCAHGCKWRMSDNTIAECYAHTVARKFKSETFFPQGFEKHYFRPGILTEPLLVKEPAGIFMDSMSDLMGSWVPKEQVREVFAVCLKAHWHYFQLLTKNAPNLLNFDIPKNVWVGVSAPPTFMFGKELTADQQRSMVFKQLDTLAKLKERGQPVCWMSIEPLSFDIGQVFLRWMDDRGFDHLPLDWSVIGAASNGPKYFQPEHWITEKLHQILGRESVPVFHKGNLKWEPHLEEFPDCVKALKQEVLL